MKTFNYLVFAGRYGGTLKANLDFGNGNKIMVVKHPTHQSIENFDVYIWTNYDKKNMALNLDSGEKWTRESITKLMKSLQSNETSKKTKRII